jgi:hypothetical protein
LQGHYKIQFFDDHKYSFGQTTIRCYSDLALLSDMAA